MGSYVIELFPNVSNLIESTESNHSSSIGEWCASVCLSACLFVRVWLCFQSPCNTIKTTFVLLSVCASFNFVNQAKFLFMVRDGRATVNSIISRKVTITGFDLTSYRQCMSKWNHAIETMHNQCKEIGSDKCMMVSSCKRFLFHLKWFDYSLNYLVELHYASKINRFTMSSWCYTPKNGCERFWNF